MNQIVPATLEHVRDLAGRLRAADRAEGKASTGLSAEDGLLFSVALSGDTAWAAIIDGRVEVLFGVASTGADGVGSPWLMASDEILKHKTYFLKQCLRYVPKMLDAYPVLVNYVDCRNTVSIQWLHWLGFALCEVDPFHGIQRLPFIRFQLAR